MREAIAAYLKKANAKVIVFCPRVAKLREFMLLRREWFGAVNSDIHAYKTVSADPYGSEDFQAFKDDESDALKVLLLREPAQRSRSCQGVDAIVMVRPTKSPTVFYQQLGRVLSSGGKPNTARVRPLQQFRFHHRGGGDLRTDGKNLPGR